MLKLNKKLDNDGMKNVSSVPFILYYIALCCIVV